MRTPRLTGCVVVIAEVEMREEPELGIRRDEKGIHALGRLENGEVRVVVREEDARRSGEPTLRDLSRALIAVPARTTGFTAPDGSRGSPT